MTNDAGQDEPQRRTNGKIEKNGKVGKHGWMAGEENGAQPNRRRGDKKRGQSPLGLLKILMLPHLHA